MIFFIRIVRETWQFCTNYRNVSFLNGFIIFTRGLVKRIVIRIVHGFTFLDINTTTATIIIMEYIAFSCC